VIQDVVQDLPLLPSPKVSSPSERQTKHSERERERERERESFWLAVWFLKDLPPNAVLELRISSTTIIIIILQQQQQLHCILLCLFVVIAIVDFFGFF